MLYIDHINHVLSTLRETDVTDITTDKSTEAWKAQEAVKRAVKRIWNYKQWSFKGRITTFSTVSGTEDYILSKDVGNIYQILSSVAPYHIHSISEQTFDTIEPNRTRTGNPSTATLFEMRGVNTQPSSASVITIVSSSTSDTTENVIIRGLVSDEDDFEELTLNGNTNVNSSKSFSRIDSITKSAVTVGRITITSNSAAVTNAVMGRLELTMRFKRLRLYPEPAAVITITIKHFTRSVILTDRYHDTEIPRDWDYVVDALAVAFALQAKGQDQINETTSHTELAIKILEQDMATEEHISSDITWIPLPFDTFGTSLFGGPPSGFSPIEGGF